MKTSPLTMFVALALALPCAGIENIVAYQGQLAKSGSPYSGSAFLKFTLLTNNAVVWTHDGSAGPQPTGVVTAQVSMGFYTIYLGDTNTTAALPLRAFNLPGQLMIRVWVATPGDVGYTQLAPDRPITAAATALNAGALSGMLLQQLMQKWTNVVVVAKAGGDVTTIQAGVNLAARMPPAAAVVICPGTYDEMVTCSQNVALIGLAREGVLVRSGMGAGITVPATLTTARVQDVSIEMQPTSYAPAIVVNGDVMLARLTIRTTPAAAGVHGLAVSNGMVYMDDLRITTTAVGAHGMQLRGAARVTGRAITITTKGGSAIGVQISESAQVALHDVTIETFGLQACGIEETGMPAVRADTLRITTRGASAPGVYIHDAPGGWYNDVAIKTHGGAMPALLPPIPNGSHGVYLFATSPTFENLSVDVLSASNTAGIYLHTCWNPPLVDDATIRTYGYDCPGMFCVTSRVQAFQVNIAIEGGTSEDDWLPLVAAPGCGVVSTRGADPYLNNCIIQMGNWAPSLFALQAGAPVPTNLRPYNCTCRDQVAVGPRWYGYSIDLDKLLLPLTCRLSAAHNRLGTPGPSGLGYPRMPVDASQFMMVIAGIADPQGNVPDNNF